MHLQSIKADILYIDLQILKLRKHRLRKIYATSNKHDSYKKG